MKISSWLLVLFLLSLVATFSSHSAKPSGKKSLRALKKHPHKVKFPKDSHFDYYKSIRAALTPK